MTPHNLRQVRQGLAMTQAAMALQLGISRRQYIRYEDGLAQIPRLVGLAVFALLKK